MFMFLRRQTSPPTKPSTKKSKPELSEEAKKAQEAVEAAIQKLPPESKVKFSAMEQREGGWNQGNEGAVPPNHGQKVLSFHLGLVF